MKGKRAILMTFDLMGHGVEFKGGPGYRLSGHDSPEDWPSRPMNDNDNYEGCAVVDERPALDRFPGLAFRQPLVNVKLQTDGIDPIGDVGFIGEALSQPESFGLLAAVVVLEGKSKRERSADRLESIGPFDCVSVHTFIRWWKEYGPDCRFGIVRNGRIVWD